MSISFDTNACSGFNYTDEIQAKPGLAWYKKACPNCNAVHGNRKEVCACGHTFLTKEKIKKKRNLKVKPRKSVVEMLADSSNKTMIAKPTAPASGGLNQARLLQLQGRISDLLALIASAQREMSTIILNA
jgi:hypothetical protein